MNLEQRFKEETGFDAYADNDLRPKVPRGYYVEWLEEQLTIGGVRNSKRFEKQDLLRAYQAGAIEQKDNDLKRIDVVTLGNLQEDSQVWYERYIG